MEHVVHIVVVIFFSIATRILQFLYLRKMLAPASPVVNHWCIYSLRSLILVRNVLKFPHQALPGLSHQIHVHPIDSRSELAAAS